MKLVPWYEPEFNTDTIKSVQVENKRDVDDPDHYWLDCGRLGRISGECCMGFIPQKGDRVELFIDDDNEVPGWILLKTTPKDTIRDLIIKEIRNSSIVDANYMADAKYRDYEDYLNSLDDKALLETYRQVKAFDSPRRK
ncbi:MAG: hypothetical protein WC390_10245 [Sulfurimonas sp.]|jgi:hypothetical protein